MGNTFEKDYKAYKKNLSFNSNGCSNFKVG